MALPLDFFTLDFDDEYSALHGGTLREQAEYSNDAIRYILSTLYGLSDHQRKGHPKPTSIILIGHSMGGFVARTLFTMPNHLNGSVNTLITLATPHVKPPHPSDYEMVSTYRNVNSWWRANDARENNEISLVSITGGNLDKLISSESTILDSILQPTNMLSLSTSSIPDVWVISDHQAILWCNQLVRKLIRTLFDIVNASDPAQTIPVNLRMRIFRSRLLPVLELRQPAGEILPLKNASPFSPIPSTAIENLLRSCIPQPNLIGIGTSRVLVSSKTLDLSYDHLIRFQSNQSEIHFPPLDHFFFVTNLPFDTGVKSFSILVCDSLDLADRCCVDLAESRQPFPLHKSDPSAAHTRGYFSELAVANRSVLVKVHVGIRFDSKSFLILSTHSASPAVEDEVKFGASGAATSLIF